jgi:lysophospholipase L1-like esterase
MDTNYKNSLLADNLHPNQTGYAKMADVWFAALDPYLRP